MSKPIAALMIIALICFFSVSVDRLSGGAVFGLVPPYAYAAHYIFQPNGGSSQSVVNRFLGTGFVKAKPAAPPLLSSVLYGAASGISFVTSEWRFSGGDQSGNINITAQLTNLQVSSPVGIPASLQVWLIMEDFSSDYSLFNAKPYELYAATASRSSPINLNNSTSWNWFYGHLYRSVIFLIAAGAGARSYASSAQANFTLTSITWEGALNFPLLTGVYCKNNEKILYDNTSVLLARGQPILLQGCLGIQNANSRANVTLIGLNGNSFNVTPHNGVPIDSAGNFSASIPAPDLSNGPYIVRVKSLSGVDPDDSIDATFGILPAPSFEPLMLIPILAGLSILPLFLKRRSRKGFPSRKLQANSKPNYP